MTDDLTRQLEELRQLFEQGILTEETYQTAVAALTRPPTQSIDVSGSGGVATDHSVAAGESGTAIGGDVNAGGDVVGHDKTVQGDEVHGDKVAGDKVMRDKITYEAPPDPAIAASARAERLYRDWLFQHCNSLPLASLGEDNFAGEVTLEQVYIALDTTTRVQSEEGKGKGKRQEMRSPDEKERVVGALEAATDTPKLVLLGEAGGGKSSCVRQIIAHLLRGDHALAGWPNNLLPVLTYVRDLSAHLTNLRLDEMSDDERGKALVGAVWAHWEERLAENGCTAMTDRLRDALADGDVLLVFDGLDEVPFSTRLVVRQTLRDLLRRYPKIQRLIVTSRTRSYTEDVALSGFRSYTLAPFTDEQVGHFVAAWYNAQAAQGALSRSKAKELADDLAGVARSGALRELAVNPMLLTTMAIIHQREVGLPDERVKLYDMAVEVLINRWQKHKGLAPSIALQEVLGNRTKLHTILERLAYEVHNLEAGDEADLPRGDLLILLEEPEYLGDAGLAADFLDYVDQRAGLLIGRGGSATHPQRYAFAHRTFGEYLAGCYLLGGRGETILRTYRAKVALGDYWYLAAILGAEELLHNRRRPTELMDLMYALCPASEPQTDADWRAIVWSGQMATLLPDGQIAADAGHPDGGGAYLTRVCHRLLGVMRQSGLTPVERIEAGRALGKLGDARVDVLDPLQIEWCEVPAGEFVMGGDAPGTDDKQFTYDIPYAYRMACYPATNAQFAVFVDVGGYQVERYWPEAVQASRWTEQGVKMWRDDAPRIGPRDYGTPFRLPNHPVVGVSWYEALAFTRWLTEQMRESGQLGPDWEIRLPNEPEWEKAARGTDGRRYPWGETISENEANYGDTGIGSTSAVGCFPNGVSPYGCEEIVGNVWEWTRSLYADYPYDPEDGRENLGAGDSEWRVLRGGSFFNDEHYVRCAARISYYPNLLFEYYGFRVVAAPIPLRSGDSGD